MEAATSMTIASQCASNLKMWIVPLNCLHNQQMANVSTRQLASSRVPSTNSKFLLKTWSGMVPTQMH